MAGYGTEIYVAQQTKAYTTVASAAKAASGKLCRIVITATLTGSIQVNDNASAASGTLLFVSPANPTVGTIFDLMMPAAFGIFVTPGSAGSFTVSFS